MIRQELVEYLKQTKAEGHSLDSVKSVLIQQGWSEQDIEESAIAMFAPSVPRKEAALSAPAKQAETKIPDHYISPLSVLLAAVLFFCLYTLTGQIIEDIEGVLVPFAAETVEGTPAYQALEDRYGRNIPQAERERVKDAHDLGHKKDSINLLFVQGVVSVLFWILAFAIHHFIGNARRHFLPLSLPFFITAGVYLVYALFGVIAQLFERDAQVAVYATLALFIVIVTASFLFYQKRSHTEKAL